METEIRVRPAETSMQPHRPSPSLSKQSEIVKLLTKFSLRRQAAVNPETLALFASDLMHVELADLESALTELSNRPRRDGETAFPDLATVLETVRGVRRIRGEHKAIDAENERVAHYKAHPELYMTTEDWAEISAPLSEKFGFEKPKEIDLTPHMLTCPHCSKELPVAGNIRVWSPEELEDQAKVLREIRAIADRNRAMAKLPLEDVVEEVA